MPNTQTPSNMYSIVEFEDPSMTQLAGCELKTKTIRINRAVTPEILRDYFQGKYPSKYSKQKQEVLARLNMAGWSTTHIENLTHTQRGTRRFLILHEISHLNHKDSLHYKSDSHETRIQIETRACIEALEILQRETRKNKGHTSTH